MFQSAKRRGAKVTIEKGVHDERLAAQAKQQDKDATSAAVEQGLDDASSKVQGAAQDAKASGNQALDKVRSFYPADMQHCLIELWFS